MKLNLVRFGERYGDDSGWEIRLEVDARDPDSSYAVEIEINGTQWSCSMEKLWWLAQAIAQAREQLDMDKQQLFPMLSVGKSSVTNEGKS